MYSELCRKPRRAGSVTHLTAPTAHGSPGCRALLAANVETRVGDLRGWHRLPYGDTNATILLLGRLNIDR